MCGFFIIECVWFFWLPVGFSTRFSFSLDPRVEQANWTNRVWRTITSPSFLSPRFPRSVQYFLCYTMSQSRIHGISEGIHAATMILTLVYIVPFWKDYYARFKKKLKTTDDPCNLSREPELTMLFLLALDVLISSHYLEICAGLILVISATRLTTIHDPRPSTVILTTARFPADLPSPCDRPHTMLQKLVFKPKTSKFMIWNQLLHSLFFLGSTTESFDFQIFDLLLFFPLNFDPHWPPLLIIFLQ